MIAQGDRKLLDAAFLQSDTSFDSDPLRYEKRMIDRWVNKELGAPRT